MKKRNHYILLWVLAAFAVIAVSVMVWKRHQIGHVVDRLTGQADAMHVDVPRSQFPVKGIDVSHHNGRIDFRKVASDSVDFVIIKASEGVDHRDSLMAMNYREAIAAGLKVGFYHFFRFNRGGVRQGRNFLGATRGCPTQLPMVIDVETASNPETDYYLVVGRLRDMIGYLRRKGRRVMIYCNSVTYDKYIRGNFDDLDLWLASQSTPEDLGDTRHLWQHSHKGRVNGINSDVDINTFNGSRAEFEAWVAEGDSAGVVRTDTVAPRVQ